MLSVNRFQMLLIIEFPWMNCNVDIAEEIFLRIDSTVDTINFTFIG